MKNKKNSKFLSFFKKYRVLTLTLFLFLILLPLIFIPTIYIYQIASSKHVVFEDKSNKAVMIDKQDYFDIEFNLYNIVKPQEENSGYYEFDYKITPKEGGVSEVNDIYDISFNAQLSVKRDKYTSLHEELIEVLESTPNSRLKIKFDYDMDKSILPFLKPKGPTLYLVIYFTEEIHNLTQEYQTIFVEVPYN